MRLLLGWDGLGVTSYLLVNYYRREKRFNASMLTAITNRLGDVVILLFIAMNSTPATFNYGLITSSNLPCYTGVFLILLAAMTKRAQVPFSAWLPAAIAAPTPVSALVHSSTLVTAGVYLLIRFNYVLINTGWRNILCLLGGLTIIIAGSAAMVELDIKKIIALSTLRQLGLIFFTLGLGEIFLRWFHLIRHAYFKAIMFIGAGAIIHRVKDYQDVRKIGSLSVNNYFISSAFLIGSLSLCGMPFLSGFYSKDTILEQFLISKSGVWAVLMCFVATVLTAGYSVRVLSLLFVSFSIRERFGIEADLNSRIGAGVAVLVFPSIIGGFMLTRWLQISPRVFIPLWLKIIILLSVVMGGGAAFYRNLLITPNHLLLRSFHQIWFLPLLISPILRKFRMLAMAESYKSQEVSWVVWRFSGWVRFVSKANIFPILLRRGLLARVLIILLTLLII
jgi:NADH-ubiquinone oxidoreductase chain 5